MALRIHFAPEAEAQIVELSLYIAKKSSREIARKYIGNLVGYCNSLTTFPNRGTRRDDIRRGLRITHYQGKTAIAFTVNDDVLEIVGIFHGGRDFSRILSE